MNQRQKAVRRVTEGTQTDAFTKDESVLAQQEQTMTANYRFRKKKTGKDAFTQINRFDFFDYEKEVKPMIDVLTTKTLEQSLLEVYEEEFLSQMQRYKENLHSKTKTKIIYENKKRSGNRSHRVPEGGREAEVPGSAPLPRQVPAHPAHQAQAVETGHRRRVALTRFFAMAGDAAFAELDEEERLLADQGSHVAVYTDFKDWLMGATAEYVHGGAHQRKTSSSRVSRRSTTNWTTTSGRWSSAKRTSF